MANFLVTGGAGFIGSNIVEELLKRGHSVRVLDNFSTGRRQNLEGIGAGRGKGKDEGRGDEGRRTSPPLSTSTSTSSLEVVEGDIRSPFTVMEAMSAPFGKYEGSRDRGFEGSSGGGGPTDVPSSGHPSSVPGLLNSASTFPYPIDFVLHQAALPSVPRSVKDPLTTNEVCVVGTLNVLKAAMACGVKRVIYASSSSVYGNSEDLPKHEGMTPNPMSPYAVSKLAGEHYCHVFSRLYGLETVVLRYFNVFGPRQDPTSQYAAVIPKFIAAIREGRRPVIYGDGEQSRDFTPVANVVAANLAACTVPLGGQVKAKVKVGEDAPLSTSTSPGSSSISTLTSTSTFLLSNVAVGSRFTLNFLVAEICRILGKHIEPIYEEPRPGDVKHSLASIGVLRERLGLRQPVTFSEGLERLCREP